MKRAVLSRVLVSILTVWVWSTVLAATESRYEWPTVNGLAINNACATEENFRSLAPVRVCVETAVVARQACRTGEAEICRPLRDGEFAAAGEVVREDIRCVAREERDLEVSRMVSTLRCVEPARNPGAETNGCLRFAEHRFKSERTFHVAKFEQRDGDFGEVYVGQEVFTVPECR